MAYLLVYREKKKELKPPRPQQNEATFGRLLWTQSANGVLETLKQDG